MECCPTPVVSHTRFHNIARLQNNKSQEAAAVSGIQGQLSRSTHYYSECYSRGQQSLLLLPKVQTDTGAHPACYSMGTGVLPRGYSYRNLKLTTLLYVVSRLRFSGAAPVRPTRISSWCGQGQFYLSFL
jgi:hypothetical protein